jgi:hypothetical protein
VLLLVVAGVLTACGDGAATTTAAPGTTSASDTTAAPATTGPASTTEVPTLEESTTTTAGGAFELTSSAFEDGGDIPVEHSCDGANTSPPLAWGSAPAEAETVAVLMDDPDAGPEAWVHWVIFNIPTEAGSLPEGVPGGAENGVLPDGSAQGINDFGVRGIAGFNQIGWDGPCPGPEPHQYVFRALALDTMLDLAPGATQAEVEAAVEGHVVAESTLSGSYPADG